MPDHHAPKRRRKFRLNTRVEGQPNLPLCRNTSSTCRTLKTPTTKKVSRPNNRSRSQSTSPRRPLKRFPTRTRSFDRRGVFECRSSSRAQSWLVCCRRDRETFIDGGLQSEALRKIKSVIGSEASILPKQHIAVLHGQRARETYTFVALGSGDALLFIHASVTTGCTSRGIEVCPDRFRLGNEMNRKCQKTRQIIVERDSRTWGKTSLPCSDWQRQLAWQPLRQQELRRSWLLLGWAWSYSYQLCWNELANNHAWCDL